MPSANTFGIGLPSSFDLLGLLRLVTRQSCVNRVNLWLSDFWCLRRGKCGAAQIFFTRCFKNMFQSWSCASDVVAVTTALELWVAVVTFLVMTLGRSDGPDQTTTWLFEGSPFGHSLFGEFCMVSHFSKVTRAMVLFRINVNESAVPTKQDQSWRWFSQWFSTEEWKQRARPAGSGWAPRGLAVYVAVGGDDLHPLAGLCLCLPGVPRKRFCIDMIGLCFWNFWRHNSVWLPLEWGPLQLQDTSHFLYYTN